LENACILTFKGENLAKKFLSRFYRRELIEYLLRICATWILECYGFGEKMAEHITEFFKIFVEPAFDDSTMFKHRIQIRGNQFLNKLLHDNTNGLRHIFERYKVDNKN